MTIGETKMWLHLRSTSKKRNAGDLVINTEKLGLLDMISTKIGSDKVFSITYFISPKEKVIEAFDSELECRNRFAEVLDLLGQKDAKYIANNYIIEPCGIPDHDCDHNPNEENFTVIELRKLFDNLKKAMNK